MTWRNLESVTSAFCAGVFRQLIRAPTLTCVGAGSDGIGGFVVNGVTDWTGCPLKRPPTSGFAAQIGQVLWHCRRHECWSASAVLRRKRAD